MRVNCCNYHISTINNNNNNTTIAVRPVTGILGILVPRYTKVRMASSRFRAAVTVVADIFIVLLTLMIIYAFYKYGVPFHRGLFCEDDSISYPYKTATISTACLFVLSVFIPWGLMLIWESIAHLYKSRGRDNPCRAIASAVFETTIVFLFGFGLTFSITDLGKYSIGRLRPHFLDVCKPNLSAVDCSVGYIQNYVCTGSDTDAIAQARLSFPSGHASVSFYGLTFFAMFIKDRLSNTSVTLLKPFLMGISMTGAFYITLSRIFDYYHHPSDVLFGGLLGIGVAMAMSTYLTRRRKASSTTHNVDSNVDYNLQRKLASLA